MRPRKSTLGQNDPLFPYEDGNLHYIAISNLDSVDRQTERWWEKKHRVHLRDFESYTHEEMTILMLEDFYERHPAEKEKFLSGQVEDWDGEVSTEYEAKMQKRMKNIIDRNKVDLSKWKSDSELDEDEEKALLENLGRGLPESRVAPSVVEGEFDDVF